MYMYDYAMRSCICECWKAVGKGVFCRDGSTENFINIIYNV